MGKGTGIATVLPETPPLHQRGLGSHRTLLSGVFLGPEREHHRMVHAATGRRAPASSAGGGGRGGGAGRGRRLGPDREEERADFGGGNGGRLVVLLE